MGSTFDEFKFINATGIKANVELQAPIGTVVVEDEVPGGEERTFYPHVSNIETARVSARDDDGHHRDVETITTSAEPFGTKIRRLESRWVVGSILGSMQVDYDR